MNTLQAEKLFKYVAGLVDDAKNLKDFNIKKIIYVSCNPATLARDCKILSGCNYKLQPVRAFDMFPQTAHVEAVAMLTTR